MACVPDGRCELEHGSAVLPEKDSTIASRRILRGDNFEHVAGREVAERGGAGRLRGRRIVRRWRQTVRSLDRVIRSLEPVVPSLEWVIRSLERVIRSLERVIRSLEPIADSSERVIRSAAGAGDSGPFPDFWAVKPSRRGERRETPATQRPPRVATAGAAGYAAIVIYKWGSTFRGRERDRGPGPTGVRTCPTTSPERTATLTPGRSIS